MKDLVIGTITNYNFDMIRPWVNSLERSGFTGDKAMICYNVDAETIKQLNDRGFMVFGIEQGPNGSLMYSKQNFNIVVERFKHLSIILRNFLDQYKYVVTTDVKDVIFQTDPSAWIRDNIQEGKKILAASESLYYKDEEWGNHNIYKSYGPVVHALYHDKLIVCAGVMAGEMPTMVDLFLNISLLCDAASGHHIEGGGGPDQAAYNILTGMLPYRDITQVAASEDGWAAQLGSTGPHIAYKYGSKWIEPAPILKDDMVCTSTGTPFAVVHQYDRIPEWKKIITDKYE